MSDTSQNTPILPIVLGPNQEDLGAASVTSVAVTAAQCHVRSQINGLAATLGISYASAYNLLITNL
jgi:hypothetical protein